ncbi:nuclear transport factor 2 family protein [Janthinobacterium sp.]|uniref:nuclear transport factor 2 family protein n=1 Tax=Janthinobacterium sp. TaxID=1871054 RepID=UPI0025BDB4A1|nr:nuclear transport factor 2 family protein [Janthinobacterium sp.]NBV15027.1 nuclear transport factor 2 family protein [Janthinobacterium sp.]
MQKLVNQFIRLANAFDVEGTLALFTPDAVIEDVSVGCAFAGIEGIRRYLEQFFVGYNTASKLLSLEQPHKQVALVRVDFTGTFGHEIGSLRIQANAAGLIERIDADLE